MTGSAQVDRARFRVGPTTEPDRYVLGPAVASGAEGILYRGWMPTSMGFEIDVAIKMLQPRFIAQVDEWYVRWMEQVELLRSLQFPGVVSVRDGFIGPLPHPAGETGEGRTLYLVMNWVEGEPLDCWVRRRPDRDRMQAMTLLLPVAAALDLMHSGRATGGVSVVHRDVKPSNIIVTGDGTVLVDFGLTRGLPQGSRLSGVTGTPGYIAPESVESGVYTAATDRYALGAVAYFILTGVEPPTIHDPAAIRSALAAVPGLDDDATAHILAMLDDDPSRRPEGLANWVGQLRRSSLGDFPGVLAPEDPKREPARPHAEPHISAASAPAPPLGGRFSKRTALRRGLLAVGLVIVLSGAGWRLLNQTSDDPGTVAGDSSSTTVATTTSAQAAGTSAPTATTARSFSPLFFDDFSAGGRWETADDEASKRGYVDGQYSLAPKRGGLYLLQVSPTGNHFGDLRIEADMTRHTEGGGIAFGVYCRRTGFTAQERSVSYLATIDPGGPGESASTPPADWTRCWLNREVPPYARLGRTTWRWTVAGVTHPVPSSR